MIAQAVLQAFLTMLGQEPASGDLYPLEVGRTWTYRQIVSCGNTRWEEFVVRMVTGKAGIRTNEDVVKEAFVLRTFPDPIPVSYAVVEESKIVVYEPSRLTDRVVCYPSGTIPKTMADAKAADPRLRTRKVTVPHGTFEGIEWPRPGGEEPSMILVPGIGIVNSWNSSKDGCHLWQVGPLDLVAVGKAELDREPDVAELAQPDPARRFRAVVTIVAQGDRSLPSLRSMMIGRIADARFDELVTLLDHADPKIRDRAWGEIRAGAVMAMDQIRKALGTSPSPEVTSRLAELLRDAEARCIADPKSEQMIGRWLVSTVLSMIGTPGAEKLLGEIAKESPVRRERLWALHAQGELNGALAKTQEYKDAVRANTEVSPEMKAYLDSRARWRSRTTVADIQRQTAAAEFVVVGKPGTHFRFNGSLCFVFTVSTVLKGPTKDVSAEKPVYITVEIPEHCGIHCRYRDTDFVLFLSAKALERSPTFPPPVYPLVAEGEGIVLADEESLGAVRAAVRK